MLLKHLRFSSRFWVGGYPNNEMRIFLQTQLQRCWWEKDYGQWQNIGKLIRVWQAGFKKIRYLIYIFSKTNVKVVFYNIWFWTTVIQSTATCFQQRFLKIEYTLLTQICCIWIDLYMNYFAVLFFFNRCIARKRRQLPKTGAIQSSYNLIFSIFTFIL